ncbi:unnamed protein product, partial [Thlaspi arvense]
MKQIVLIELKEIVSIYSVFVPPNLTPAQSNRVDLPPALLSRFNLLWLILDRADMYSDLELSKHVFNMDISGFSSAYISAARRLCLYVPSELGEYIATAYSCIKQEEARSNTPRSYTTVRTLLSILCISAISTSKVEISLYVDDMQTAGLDAISDTYSIIRDEASRSKKTHVSYANALNWISRKGYSEAQLKECLEGFMTRQIYQ